MNNRKARKTSKGREQQALTGCGNSCLNTGYSEVNVLRGGRVIVQPFDEKLRSKRKQMGHACIHLHNCPPEVPVIKTWFQHGGGIGTDGTYRWQG